MAVLDGASPCGEDLRGLARLLIYGTPETRRDAAERLRLADDSGCWQLLASTARSDESWLLRARCLELLGLAAGGGSRPIVERILGSLFASTKVVDDGSSHRAAGSSGS